jgi:transcriptional regulator with XRE-family HTH domain
MLEFDKVAVGRTIKIIRKEKGLSQEVCSGLAGMARSHLAMVETGTKQANFETIWKLSNAFDMLPHELVRKIEEETLK